MCEEMVEGGTAKAKKRRWSTRFPYPEAICGVLGLRGGSPIQRHSFQYRNMARIKVIGLFC